jgi:predicted Zn-ribbon and HTH transcriptional regulator
VTNKDTDVDAEKVARLLVDMLQRKYGWERLAEALEQAAETDQTRGSAQTSGPRCAQCGAFTTHTRVRSHGLCMRCETSSKLVLP